MLQVNELNFSIRTGHILQGSTRILDQVSFQVPKGKATAYLGVNGAGKTSTFRLLCGLAQADSGDILFKDQRCRAGIPSSSLGFMPEQPYFYKNITPRELLFFFGKLSGLKNNDLLKAIKDWSEQLNFELVLDRRLASCSKGQIQRVGLAQALLHQPEFLLLDEPMSGLDPIGRELVRDTLIKQVAKGVTLLFSSHILSDAESICDQAIILHKGKVRFCGNTDDLKAEKPKSQIVCSGPTELVQTLGATDISKLPDNNWSLVCTTEQQRNKLLQKILSEPQLRMHSVTNERESLEQAFLKLVAPRPSS